MADNGTIALAEHTAIPASETGASESHPTATNMMDLSQELRREICSYLPRRDLVNICRVSSTMQDAAVRALYRTISLEVTDADTTTFERVSNMLSRENPGIDHIQRVHLTNHCSPRNSCSHVAAQTFGCVRYLINGLPRDKLKSFSWDSSHVFRSDLTALLLKRQRSLTHIELHVIEHGKQPCLSDALSGIEYASDTAENATSMYIAPDKLCCLGAAYTLLKSAKKLKILTITCNDLENDERRIETGEDGLQIDRVFTGLFGRLPEQRRSDPLCLTSLTLQHVDLKEFKSHYGSVIIFEELKKLHLYNCWRPDTLLETLMYPAKGRVPRLEELIINDVQGEGEGQLPSSLDSFLGSFKGLKSFKLQLVNDGVLPAIRNIVWHGETLEKLYIGVRKAPRNNNTPHTSYTKLKEIKELCSSLPQLKQLAFSMDDWPGAASCTLGTGEKYSEFEENVLMPLAELPKLQFLNIINWPCLESKWSLPIAAYGALLQAQATAFFRCFREAQVVVHPHATPDSLRVLAFGEHKDFENRIDGLVKEDQKPFLPRFVFYRGEGQLKWSDAKRMPLAIDVTDECERYEHGLDVGVDLLENNFEIKPSWGRDDGW